MSEPDQATLVAVPFTPWTALYVEKWKGSTVHVLKTVQPHFGDVLCYAKTFEARRDDRGFQVADLLVLCEWDGERFTGRDAVREVTHVLRGPGFGIEDGYVVMSMRPPISVHGRSQARASSHE